MNSKITFESVLAKIGLYVLFVAAILVAVLFVKVGQTNKKVAETSAYTRVTDCIVGKVANPPTSQADVEKCYVQVEKATGISLERFDKQTQ